MTTRRRQLARAAAACMRRARTVSAVRSARRWRSAAGQTFTEYLMILGIVTAIIVALSKMVIPAIAWGIWGFLDHVAVFVSSV